MCVGREGSFETADMKFTVLVASATLLRGYKKVNLNSNEHELYSAQNIKMPAIIGIYKQDKYNILIFQH